MYPVYVIKRLFLEKNGGKQFHYPLDFCVCVCGGVCMVLQVCVQNFEDPFLLLIQIFP